MCAPLVPLVITAHADLAPALAEADVLSWLEELGLDVALGEASHLLAFDGISGGQLIAEVDFYALDGGRATQVRWHLRHQPERDPPDHALISRVRGLIESSALWCIDAVIPTATATDPR